MKDAMVIGTIFMEHFSLTNAQRVVLALIEHGFGQQDLHDFYKTKAAEYLSDAWKTEVMNEMRDYDRMGKFATR